MNDLLRSFRSKALVVTLSAALLFSVSGCSSKANGSSSTTSTVSSTTASTTTNLADLKFPSGKGKIGLAMREMVNDYDRGIVAGVKARVAAAGGTVVVTDAGSDVTKHNQNIESLINSGVSGLIIGLGDTTQIAPLIAKAKAKGIWVATCAVGAYTQGSLTDVGGDESLMGEIMSRELLQSINYKGDVYVFWVPGAPLLETRKHILEAMCKDYPQVTLHDVATLHDPAKVQSQMEDILTAHPDKGSIAAVWAAYDVLGSGADQAIIKAGRGNDIKMASIDGDQIGFQMMAQTNGPYISIVAQDSNNIGTLATNAILEGANGEGAQVPHNTYTACYVVTRNNMVATAELRYGSSFFADQKIDLNALIKAYPQNQEVDRILPLVPNS